ncbi:hypothetical protein MPSEU_000795900 [Mayamaea pseudoterrestris]|nr:hypothetical protein MPSEU_000795900 [Mayamaea pseudoterrestris]
MVNKSYDDVGEIPAIRPQSNNETMVTEAASVASSSSLSAVEIVAWEQQGVEERKESHLQNDSVNRLKPRQEKHRRRTVISCSLLGLLLVLIAAAVAVPLLMFHQDFSEAATSSDEFSNSSSSTSSPSTKNDDEEEDDIPIVIHDDEEDTDDVIKTPIPTPSPTTPAAPVYTNNITTFYVIGDVPYNSQQAIEIRQQMLDVPDDVEFVINVGDIRNAGRDLTCVQSDYTDAEALFNLSRAPVFMLLGDNDWNDCPNPDEGLTYWRNQFVGFENKYWSAPFTISRLENHPETFTFLWKNTLFVGLQLVGGDILDESEWNDRLASQANWTMDLITLYRSTLDSTGDTGRVVLFGHCNPNSKHKPYFEPLEDFIESELNNSLPMLYVNGDSHRWEYNTSFQDQPSFLRIMVTGGSSEPPLKIVIDGNGLSRDAVTAFAYDRQLDGWVYGNGTFPASNETSH